MSSDTLLQTKRDAKANTPKGMKFVILQCTKEGRIFVVYEVADE